MFDVILMDVQMPNMDGYEATGMIREKEQRAGGHVPSIVCGPEWTTLSPSIHPGDLIRRLDQLLS